MSERGEPAGNSLHIGKSQLRKSTGKKCKDICYFVSDEKYRSGMIRTCPQSRRFSDDRVQAERRQ